MSWGNNTKGTADEVVKTMEGWRDWLAKLDANASEETKKQHQWQLEKAIDIANDQDTEEVPEGKHLAISASGHWNDGSPDGRTPPSGYLSVSYSYVEPADVPVGSGG